MSTDKPQLREPLNIREEYDNFGFLYDPDTGKKTPLNSTSIFICRLLDGQHSTADIAAELKAAYGDVPASVKDDIATFVAELAKEGLLAS